jgi:hypothetical protein
MAGEKVSLAGGAEVHRFLTAHFAGGNRMSIIEKEGAHEL